MKKIVIFTAKVLLLAHLIFTVVNDLLYNGEARAKNFNRKYSELQQHVAPYFFVPWPRCIYNSADTLVLLWNYTKLLVALRCLVPKAGVRTLKNIVIVETVVNIAGGCTCLCYFLQQLTVLAGLMVCQYIRKQNKHGKSNRMKRSETRQDSVSKSIKSK